MASSNEGAELRLVSSIRYKFASASGDEKKLSDALQSQLVPLLEKAGSQHKAVRDAVWNQFSYSPYMTGNSVLKCLGRYFKRSSASITLLSP